MSHWVKIKEEPWIHLKAKNLHLTEIFSQTETNCWKCRMCLRLLLGCPSSFLIKDAPINVQSLSNWKVTSNCCHGSQRERCAALCISLIRKRSASESFTRKVIYRRELNCGDGRTPADAFRRRGGGGQMLAPDSCCLLIVCMSHLPAIATGFRQNWTESIS